MDIESQEETLESEPKEVDYTESILVVGIVVILLFVEIRQTLIQDYYKYINDMAVMYNQYIRLSIKRNNTDGRMHMPEVGFFNHVAPKIVNDIQDYNEFRDLSGDIFLESVPKDICFGAYLQWHNRALYIDKYKKMKFTCECIHDVPITYSAIYYKLVDSVTLPPSKLRAYIKYYLPIKDYESCTITSNDITIPFCENKGISIDSPSSITINNPDKKECKVLEITILKPIDGPIGHAVYQMCDRIANLSSIFKLS